MNNIRPLIVDLDGTLVKVDTLYESIVILLKKNPVYLLCMLKWATRGKAYFKSKIAAIVDIDSRFIPFNKNLLVFLESQKAINRKLILCTGANIKIAEEINRHLCLFDEVIGSNETKNLTGRNKGNYLVSRFKKKGFDYVGNSYSDLYVWENAENGIIISNSDRLIKKAKSKCNIKIIDTKYKNKFKSVLSLIRIHQWLKNTLVMVPLITAPTLPNSFELLQLTLAFISFSFCASSVYIFNDICDLQNDRSHKNKCNRALASGDISIIIGVIIAISLFVSSIIISNFISFEYTFLIFIYFILTSIYSIYLKKVILIDCFTLGILYTLRIIGGAIVSGLELSFWLINFSFFIFLSLALIKRYVELKGNLKIKKNHINGRGYISGDLLFIEILGIASGYLSVLVLALYLNTKKLLTSFETVEIIWLLVPLLLYWISSMWMQAHRNKMHDDPIIHAIYDRTSLMIGFLFIVVLLSAKFFNLTYAS